MNAREPINSWPLRGRRPSADQAARPPLAGGQAGKGSAVAPSHHDLMFKIY
jgi:hypothetical protein